MSEKEKNLVLDIDHLTVHYVLEDETVEAVNDISLKIIDIRILYAVLVEQGRSALSIVEDVHVLAAALHMRQPAAGRGVVRHRAVYVLADSQSVVVVAVVDVRRAVVHPPQPVLPCLF